MGQAIGAKRHDDAPPIVRRTVAVAAAWQCLMGLLYLVFPRTLMSLFASDLEPSRKLVELGAVLLAVSAGWQLFDAVVGVMSEALRAAGDTVFCLWARVGIAWVLWLPAAYVAVHVLRGGPIAAILCMIAYLAALSLALTWRFAKGAWRTIDLMGVPELPV